MITEDQVMLCDMVSAALQNPRKGVAGFKKNSLSKGICKFLNLEMARMQRFFVSNDLLEHAVISMFSKPKTILSAAQLGIPPYNNMWIEWDEIKRQQLMEKYSKKYNHDFFYRLPVFGRGRGQTFEKLSEDDAPVPTNVRTGYHIRRDTDFSQFFAWNNCLDGRDNDAEKVMAYGYGFAAGEKTFESCKSKTLQSQQQKDGTKNFLQEYSSVLMGLEYCKAFQSSRDLKVLKDMVVPYGHPMIVCQAHESELNEDIYTKPNIFDTKAALASAHGLSGDYRFLVSILGFINYDLIIQTKDTPTRMDRLSFANRSVPKKQYKVLSIELPKPRGRVVYERMFTGHGSPKCEHWRRGHWRRIRDKNGVLSHRVWIDAVKVGNPELGTIIHDYDLKSSKSDIVDLSNINPEGSA